MFNTLKISFSLRNTYRVNGILYSLKQTPLIKKLLPEKLYGVWGLKIFANIISVIIEIISVFLGKLLYFFLMVFLPAFLIVTWILGEDISLASGMFMHIIFLLSVIGSYMNTFLFNPTRDKYYGIIIMRMNAREYALVDYAYSNIKLIIGYIVFGLFFGEICGVPAWLCLLIPLFVTGLKMTVAALDLYKYERIKTITNENKLEPLKWIITFLLFLLAYIPPLFGICIPIKAVIYLMLIPIITGALSLIKILSFKGYRSYYKLILKPETYHKDFNKHLVNDYTNKLISTNTNITSKRKGFDYFNELFIKRHHKTLWKTSKIITLIISAIIIIVITILLTNPDTHQNINALLLEDMPIFVIWVYSMNRGTAFTQVLFMNCDHSLLTYSFYKQPKFLLQLFTIRLRELIKINLLPTSVMGLGMSTSLFLSGGTDNIINYILLFATIPAISIFFSAHYLTVYYLLQPYNRDTEMKGGVYQVVNVAIYFICFFVMSLKIPTITFGALAILFSLLYSAAACLLVYKIAPKTFKLRI